MSILLHGDCLEELKCIDSNSVDLIFCDLPYGQTSCKWDCCIDLDKFWIEVMRIKKLNTPIFMTTTTKFGVSLINSAPKKCPFRWDIVWVKSAAAGFLSAKKMPMRKHEMVYVFYEKLPFYDLSSHTHKFINHKENTAEESKTDTYGKITRSPDGKVGQYDPPLPVSVVKEEGCYGPKVPNSEAKYGQKCARQYDPPLPTSVVKEEIKYDQEHNSELYGNVKRAKKSQVYDPPLPTSVVKEVKENGLCKNYGVERLYYYDENGKKLDGSDGTNTKYDPPLPTSVIKEEKMNSELYGEIPTTDSYAESVSMKKADAHQPRYDPPLPVSVIKEEAEINKVERKSTYGNIKTHDIKTGKNNAVPRYDPPLPVSVIKEPEPEPEPEPVKVNRQHARNGAKQGENDYSCYQDPRLVRGMDYAERVGEEGVRKYEPPLPNSILEVKSTRGKHSTEKPVALMEWILKYFSKEGDTVLDPTMGSGSTGVACKNMNRNFIGIEMDAEIYEVAVNRIG
jgi:DNA modification methylase